VAAGSDRDVEVQVPGEADAMDHVRLGLAPGDHCGVAVDAGVEERAGVVVAGIFRPESVAGQVCAQGGEAGVGF
jgi:hypothetical protein